MPEPRHITPLPWQRVLVVFGDAAQPRWLRLLPAGFRHVFLVFETEAELLVYEPMSHCTQLSRWARPDGLDVAGFYRAQGLRVVEAAPAAPPRRALAWRPYTCVEAVKRLLGLRQPWVLTPRRLYRKLILDNAARKE